MIMLGEMKRMKNVCCGRTIKMNNSVCFYFGGRETFLENKDKP